jgi:hypothetical protein
MVEYAATDKEREEIKRAVEWHQACLDVEEREVREKEKLVNNPDPYRGLIELYQEFERRNREYIADSHQTIGFLIKLRERFSNNDRIQQHVRYFIDVELAEIGELMEDIEHDREKIREFKRLRR